jgi:RNA-dependent RNA polymerase
MELELKYVDVDADIYDVRKAVEKVLHGPDLYDPNHPDNKGRKPNFMVLMDKSPAGRIHNGKAILRLPSKLGSRLFRWYNDSDKHRIVVHGRTLRIYKTYERVSRDVEQVLEKAFYIDPDQDKIRTLIEERAHQVHLRIAKVQFGVWYRPTISPTSNAGRSFSVEYERDFLCNSAAYLHVVYEHKLIRIDVRATILPISPQVYTKFPFIQIGQRETEETSYLVLVKFSSIKKLGIGYDEFGQPCESLRQHRPSQRFVQLKVNPLQSSYSICIRHPPLNKKVTIITFQRASNRREDTRRGTVYLR